MHYPSGLKRKAPQISLPYPRTNEASYMNTLLLTQLSKGHSKQQIVNDYDYELTVIIGSNVYSSYTSGMNLHLRNHHDQWQHFLDTLGRTIKPDIAEIMRYLHKFTNKNAHIF